MVHPVDASDKGSVITPIGVSRSWARRKDDQVYVELHLPDFDVPSEGAQLLLKCGSRRIEVPAVTQSEGMGGALAADISSRSLGSGTWQLSVRLAPATEYEAIGARLIFHPDNPVAVIARSGRRDKRERSTQPRTVGTRVARSLARATNALLRELPPERAVRYQQRAVRYQQGLRRAGRRLLVR